MPKNQQLFKAIPPVELVNEVLGFFGIQNFNENYNFTIDDINNKHVIQKLLKLPFEDFYIHGKYELYFSKMDYRSCITILRQLLKIYGYKVITIEKYTPTRKYLSYHIEKLRSPPPPIDPNTPLEFD